MSDTTEEAVDIPDPDLIPPPPPSADPAQFDPGSDLPLPRREPALGEDPAYDPGGMGFQPDVIEDQEDYD